MTDTKAGIQTSEFWVHSALQAVTLWQLYSGHLPADAAAWIITILGAVYIAARTITKVGDAVFGALGKSSADYQLPPAVTATTNPANTTAMGIVMWLAAGTLALCMLTGCPATETNRVAQSIVATKESADLANQLHQLHVTTKDQEQVIGELLTSAARAEDAYYDAIRAGDPAALKVAKAAWAVAANKLTTELAKYKLPPPATQPTSGK